MKSKVKRTWQALLMLAAVAWYVFLVVHSLGERERRSLHLLEQPGAGDYARASIRIVKVDPAASELTARIRFRFAGSIARDQVTPATGLKFFFNDPQAAQEFEFAGGKPVSPVEAVFSLEGNADNYPFDRYETYLGIGAATLQEGEPVPVCLELSASIPGMKFRGNIAEKQRGEARRIDLKLSRAKNTIVIAISVMMLMMFLAIGVLLMALRVIPGERKFDLFPLSLSITLVFGLPALRNTQPGIPAQGVLGDYISFFWAEQIVAASAVILVVVWLLRSR